LKIAIAHPKFGALGGGSVVMRDIVDCLAKNANHEVTVLAREWRGKVPAAVHFEALNPPYFGSVLRDWTFERAVRRVDHARFDLIVSDQKIPGIDVYIAGGGVHIEWTLRKLRAAPVWRKLFGAITPQHLFTQNAERRLFRSQALRAVVCVSKTVRRDVLQHYGLAPERVHVAYNGIDLQRFDTIYRTAHRQRLRAEMALGNKLVLLFVGGGMRNKGIRETLAAAARSGLDFELIVVGKDKNLGAFRALAESLGIGPRCRFVGAQPEILPYYAVADIFVLPSHFETFGLVYLEALAMGRHGYRIDPDSVDDIASKLQLLSRAAPGMASECIALARRFSREAMAARLEAVLAQLA
jgi:UDP-glucose:(heptosyl)LPS alpha-1,3-glucosyltransferase